MTIQSEKTQVSDTVTVQELEAKLPPLADGEFNGAKAFSLVRDTSMAVGPNSIRLSDGTEVTETEFHGLLQSAIFLHGVKDPEGELMRSYGEGLGEKVTQTRMLMSSFIARSSE